jgi:hypothetical protein
MQDGEAVASLGIFEHQNREIGRRYLRDKDPRTRMGNELIYLLAE